MSPDFSPQRAVSADRRARFGALSVGHFVMLFLEFLQFFVSGFLFSMFSASFWENTLF